MEENKIITTTMTSLKWQFSERRLVPSVKPGELTLERRIEINKNVLDYKY